MKSNNIKKMIMGALFAALICIATMIFPIPLPGNGYANLGDCFVLVAAWALGPVTGMLAAGIGSAFADIFSGFAFYAPATFIIKALMALAAVFVFKGLSNVFKKYNIVGRIISGLVAEAIMVLGYFFYEAVFIGEGLAAAVNIIGNVGQGAVGIVTSIILIEVLERTKLLESLK